MEKEQEKNKSLREEVKKADIENETMKCDKCELTTTSKKGMKTHIKRMHSETNREIEAITCQICEAKFTANKELKQHIKR